MLTADESDLAGDAQEDGPGVPINFVGDLWVAGPPTVSGLPKGMSPC